jgi:hypothetical protein
MQAALSEVKQKSARAKAPISPQRGYEYRDHAIGKVS